MALKKAKVDYLNKEVKNVSREQLLDAIKKADERNKQIDEKSKISSKSLAVRAGT
jgi:FixJ family two-component response regulator